MFKKQAYRSGFTLIELLVVIAIIALLVSILVPSLSSAREMARKVYCQSNMRNIGMGISQYAGDNMDIVPPMMYNPSKGTSFWSRWWSDMIVQYIDAGATLNNRSDPSVMCQPLDDACRDLLKSCGVITSRMFDCPTLKTVFYYGAGNTCPYSVDYAWNYEEMKNGNSVTWCYYNAWGMTAADVSQGKPVRKLSHYGSVSQMCPVMESGQDWFVSLGGAWDDPSFLGTLKNPPHLKTWNYVCYDGHVANITSTDYWAYYQKTPLTNRGYPFYYWNLPLK